jgi:hypothetical protein
MPWLIGCFLALLAMQVLKKLEQLQTIGLLTN